MYHTSEKKRENSMKNNNIAKNDKNLRRDVSLRKWKRNMRKEE